MIQLQSNKTYDDYFKSNKQIIFAAKVRLEIWDYTFIGYKYEINSSMGFILKPEKKIIIFAPLNNNFELFRVRLKIDGKIYKAYNYTGMSSLKENPLGPYFNLELADAYVNPEHPVYGDHSSTIEVPCHVIAYITG